MIGLPAKESASLETKAERFAARFSAIRGLTPPVKVEEIARTLANISFKPFPIEIDGLCFNLNMPGKRPVVWINSKLQHHRKRFTIAHEIGHIIIPWHNGSIIDELDIDGSDDSEEYFRMEGEANKFAAELLMPKGWVLELCGKASHLQGVMRTVTLVGDVSPRAAAIRVLQIGPPGYIVSATEDDVILWSGQTPGTGARLPSRGDHISTFNPLGFQQPEIFPIGKRRYFWWKIFEKVSIPSRPLEDWRHLLDLVTEEIEPEKRHRIKQRLNAITAIPFSKNPPGSSLDVMYLELLRNFGPEVKGDADLKLSITHPRFLDYAVARIYERGEERKKRSD